MKFTCTVTINKSREKVVEYFINSDYLKECPKEFIKKELISGEASTEMVGKLKKIYRSELNISPSL